jgi:hypothetical protein
MTIASCVATHDHAVLVHLYRHLGPIGYRLKPHAQREPCVGSLAVHGVDFRRSASDEREIALGSALVRHCSQGAFQASSDAPNFVTTCVDVSFVAARRAGMKPNRRVDGCTRADQYREHGKTDPRIRLMFTSLAVRTHQFASLFAGMYSTSL